MKIDYSTTDVIAIWPKLAKPDAYQEGDHPAYKIKAELTADQGKGLMSTIRAWMKEKGIEAKGIKMPIEKDAEDENKIVARFRTNYKPAVLDASGQPTGPEFMVNNGATVRIAGVITFDTKNKRIMLRPNVVVVVKNTEGHGGTVDAAAIWGDLKQPQESNGTLEAPSDEATGEGDDPFAIR